MLTPHNRALYTAKPFKETTTSDHFPEPESDESTGGKGISITLNSYVHDSRPYNNSSTSKAMPVDGALNFNIIHA